MAGYCMVYANLYSAVVAKVTNALCTLVPRKQPSFQALFEGPKVLLCANAPRNVLAAGRCALIETLAASGRFTAGLCIWNTARGTEMGREKEREEKENG